MPEPSCVGTFRNDTPDGSWDQFRNNDEGLCYKRVRDHLLTDQRGLCAYCELELKENNRQIAHFHPKSDHSDGRTNWALIWENLWLACKGGSQPSMSPPEYLPPTVENLSCDEAKKDKILDGLVLAPGDIPAFPRLFRFEQKPDAILIAPDEKKCLNAGVSIEIVEETIKQFNLNCRRLTDARLEVHRGLEKLIKTMKPKTIPRRLLYNLAERYLNENSNGSYHSFFLPLLFYTVSLAVGRSRRKLFEGKRV